MTRPIKSEDVTINVEEESTQGESVLETGTKKHLGKLIDDLELPDPEFEYEEEYYFGNDSTPSNKEKGQVELTDGSLTVKPVSGYPFALLLGANSADGNGNVVITPKLKDPPQTINVGVAQDGHFDRIFRGGLFGSGSFSISNDGELQMDLDLDALSVDQTSFTEDNNVPNRPVWTFANVSSNLSLGAATFARLQDLSVDFSHNHNTSHYAEDSDGPYPTEHEYGNKTIEGEATIAVVDSTIYNDLLLTDTKFNTEISLSKSDCDITIRLIDCNLRSAPHNPPEEGKMEVDCEIVAEDIEIVVTDDNLASGEVYI